MSHQEIYQRLIDRLKQSLLDLPEAEELMPLMKATYTPEEASLLNSLRTSRNSSTTPVLRCGLPTSMSSSMADTVFRAECTTLGRVAPTMDQSNKSLDSMIALSDKKIRFTSVT